MSSETPPNIEDFLTVEERKVFAGLTSPAKIQSFLDATPYSADYANRSPVSVLRDRKAHCLDGALFAAAAMRRLGYPPVVIDLLPVPGRDDDHVLVIFRQNGRIGCLAKSNYVGLRYREPVFRTFRELVMSYFEFYFNTEGQKTLRGYTAPLDLSRFDALGWMWSDSAGDVIEKKFATLRRYPVLPEGGEGGLLKVDPLLFEAGTLGINLEGVYKPKE